MPEACRPGLRRRALDERPAHGPRQKDGGGRRAPEARDRSCGTVHNILADAQLKPYEIAHCRKRRDPNLEAKTHDMPPSHEQPSFRLDEGGDSVPWEEGQEVCAPSHDEKPGIRDAREHRPRPAPRGRRQRHGILRSIEFGISNAHVEAVNNKIKVATGQGYGFRNIDNLHGPMMLGRLDLRPTLPGGDVTTCPHELMKPHIQSAPGDFTEGD